MELQIFELECSEPRQPSQQSQNHSVGHREDDPAKAQIPHILNLPLIIILLVLDLLDRKDVHAFGLVHRGLNRAVEPILSRKVVLHDWNSPESIIHICKRLADRHDSLAENVHHFQIGLYKIGDLPDVELLKDVLENMRNLKDFSWHANFPIPSALLEKFGARHPSVRLHVKSSGYRPRDPYQPPDYQILSSPQLHSLDYVAYQNNPQSEHYRVGRRGEIPAIKDSLLQARNLKNLRLQNLWGGICTQADWPECQGFFKFGYGEVFPALEELDLSYDNYRFPLDLNPESCQGWANSMDWSRLRRLNLDRIYKPYHLFEALAGKVPSLKALKFDLRSIDSLLGFSNSIDGLEEIAVADYCVDVFDEVREAFFSKHGHSLKKLHINYIPWRRGFSAREMQKLVEIAPGIRNLKLDVISEYDNYMDWPEATMEPFSELHHLRELDVSIPLYGIPDGQYETEVLRTTLQFVPTNTYIRSRPLYLKEDVAEERVKSLYKQLLGIYQDSKIHRIKVTFETKDPDNVWPFILHRESPDGQRFRLEKGFYTGFGIPSPSIQQNNPTIPAEAYLYQSDWRSR